MDGLEERSASGMDVPGGGEAESAGKLGGQVTHDVAEKIVGDDDVELSWVADEFHGQSVDVEVAGLDVRILGTNGFEGALPKITRKGHGVGFVGHAKAFELVRTRVIEGEAEDALDAFARVDVFLSGDFVGSSLFEEAASTHIDAFGVFPEDDETNVVDGAVFERGEAFMEKLRGTGVNEKVELEAQAQENVGGVLVGGDPGVAKSAEEDGVELVTKHFDSALREGHMFAKEFIGAPVEVHEFEVAAMFGSGGFDGRDRDGSDFFADAVTGDNGDAGVGTTIAQRSVGHRVTPPRRE